MSKYIKLDDAIGVATRGTNNYFICKALKDLPTIEVSEDCISRVGLFEKMQSLCTETDKGCGDCHKACDIEDCLDFVMDAPRAIPQVPSEDAISREDAVNALIAHFIPQTYTGEQVEQASKLARKIMANAPSVVPKPKEGEWKSKKASIYPYGYDVECSVCGHRMGSSFGYKFCPNCGAKMKGASDD